MTDHQVLLVGAQNAQRALQSGLTTMRDCGDRRYSSLALRHFIKVGDGDLLRDVSAMQRIHTVVKGGEVVVVKKCYKDDALNLAGAGEKVKQLIDKHLFSLGINPKIPPGKWLSPNCLAEVEEN